MRTSPLLVLLSLLAAGCGEGAPEDAALPASDGTPGSAPVVDVPEADARSIEYAPELGVDLSRMEELPSGLLYRDDLEGDGTEAAAGRTVSVHYTGYLPDGTVFDSSIERGEPIVITLGEQQVIQGWEQGIPGMRVGGRRLLVIPRTSDTDPREPPR